jgi:hypothetical protein
MFIPILTLLAVTNFEQQMSIEEQKCTGVYCLTPDQRSALENWIEKHCRLHCSEQRDTSSRGLSLYTNLEGGKKLELSDGNTYEVAPEDLNISSSWVTPFPLKLEPSSDPNYPLQLTNTHTGTSIKVRRVF